MIHLTYVICTYKDKYYENDKKKCFNKYYIIFSSRI